MYAHVLYCLDEIEAELENLTSSSQGNELAADLGNHLQAMRRLVALAAEMSGPDHAASGAEAFLLSSEEDIAIAFHEELPAAKAATLEAGDVIAAEIDTDETAETEAATLEAGDDIAAEIDTDETAETEAATLEAGDDIADKIDTEVPCPAVLEIVDQLIAEASTDDLTMIRGVDAETARDLAGLGITRFATIAGWTATDITSVETAASQGRIAKENWIEQAALLAAGTMTAFAVAALAAKTPEEQASLQANGAESASEAGSQVEAATNVISLETHKRLAEGLVSRLPAKAAPSAQTPEAVVIPFQAAQAAKRSTSNRWMLRIAACIALAACAGLASLQSAPSSTSITWVIGAL